MYLSLILPHLYDIEFINKQIYDSHTLFMSSCSLSYENDIHSIEAKQVHFVEQLETFNKCSSNINHKVVNGKQLVCACRINRIIKIAPTKRKSSKYEFNNKFY